MTEVRDSYFLLQVIRSIVSDYGSSGNHERYKITKALIISAFLVVDRGFEPLCHA